MTAPRTWSNSVDFITSRVWADDDGKNRTGLVLIQEQQIFAAREVQKGDARPGGYVATGGHGGILGGIGYRREAGHHLCAGDAAHLPIGRQHVAAAVRGHRACGAARRAS